VFVHSSEFAESVLGRLYEGDLLRFEFENGEKGPSAVKLQKA
jgi:cold shock CspA family protein